MTNWNEVQAHIARRRRIERWLDIGAVLVMVLILVLGAVWAAEGQTKAGQSSQPEAQATEGNRQDGESMGAVQSTGAGGESAPPALVLARACYGEAGWNHSDCSAIFWAMRKRCGHEGRHRGARTDCEWVAHLRSYSHALHGKSERSKRVLLLPDGDSPGWNARTNRRWAALREHARRLVAGEVPDPCPKAVGWGGTMDKPRPRQVPVKCITATSNWFYRVRGKR